MYLRNLGPRGMRLFAQDHCELDGAWTATRPALSLALPQLVLRHPCKLRGHCLLLISPTGSVLSPLLFLGLSDLSQLFPAFLRAVVVFSLPGQLPTLTNPIQAGSGRAA